MIARITIGASPLSSSFYNECDSRIDLSLDYFARREALVSLMVFQVYEGEFALEFRTAGANIFFTSSSSVSPAESYGTYGIGTFCSVASKLTPAFSR